MKLVATILFLLALCLASIDNIDATPIEQTEDKVLLYLYEPARSPEAQELKDRILWERKANSLFGY